MIMLRFLFPVLAVLLTTNIYASESVVDESFTQQTRSLLDDIKANISAGKQDQVLQSIAMLAKHLENAPRLRVHSMMRAFSFFPFYHEFFSTVAAKSYVSDICSLDLKDVEGIGDQIGLLLLYADNRFHKKPSKDHFESERKEIVSHLLGLVGKLEKLAHVDDKEIEVPQSFDGNGPFIVDHHTPTFQNENEEQEYNKYIEKVKSIFQKRLDKKDASQKLEENKTAVAKTIAALYKTPPKNTSELEALLKQYKIDVNTSTSILSRLN